MTEGAAEPVEQAVAPAAAPTGEPERKSLWARLKAYWWVTGFSSAFALVHLLDGIGFSREWLRVFHAIATGWEYLMKGLGDWLRAIAPFPVDLQPAELSMITIYSGVVIPAMVPWIKGTRDENRAFARADPKLAKFATSFAQPVAILGIGMLAASGLAFVSPGDSVSAHPGLADPTADMPDGWREFGRFYIFGTAFLMIAIWNRPYFRVLVIVAGFLGMLELFYLVPIVEAALRPLIDAIDPAGATGSPAP